MPTTTPEMMERPPDPATEERDAYAALVREVVSAVTECRAAHTANKESLDRLNTGILTLISESRETRCQISRLVELREEEVRGVLALADGRRALVSKALTTPVIQLLIAGLVIAILQGLGVSWLASSYLPQLQAPPVEAQAQP